MGRKGIKISSVLIYALLLGLILEQVKVDAKKGKSCCPSTSARNVYNACRLKFSQKTCARLSGCKIVDGIISRDQCPDGFHYLTLDFEESGSAILQVDAKKGKSCCPSTSARNVYNVCRLKFSQKTCAGLSGCKIVDGIISRDQCPEGFRDLTLDFEESDSAILQVDAKKGKSCCPSTSARNVYNVCRLKFSQKTCAGLSGCKIVDGIISRDQCPDGFHYLTLDSEESDSIQSCSFGCRSFVCNIMNSVDGIEGMEIIVQRCGEGCDRFYSRPDANIGSVAE